MINHQNKHKFTKNRQQKDKSGGRRRNLVEPGIMENISAALVDNTGTRNLRREPPRSAQTRRRQPCYVPHYNLRKKKSQKSKSEQQQNKPKLRADEARNQFSWRTKFRDQSETTTTMTESETSKVNL